MNTNKPQHRWRKYDIQLVTCETADNDVRITLRYNLVEHTSDIEIFSNNSAGAIQGYGYLFHEQDEYGPRILRLNNVTDFSVHDLILVDSPAYFLNLVESYNGEVYNMVIRGASMGGLDGIDISGANYWIHDVEVTNGDECVTVKVVLFCTTPEPRGLFQSLLMNNAESIGQRPGRKCLLQPQWRMRDGITWNGHEYL